MDARSTHRLDSEQSGQARPRLAPCTYAQLLADSIRAHAAAVAVVAPGRPDLTYAGLGARIEAIASALTDAGFGRRARIGVALPDGPDLAAVLLAVCSCATCAPLNDGLDEEALRYLMVAMRLDALIVSEETKPAARRAAQRAGVAQITPWTSPCPAAGTPETSPARSRDRAPMEPPRLDDIALLMHTSGTTGAPKIVPWLQWRVAEFARNRVDLARLDASDRCLILLPLHSSAGIRRVLAGVLTGGSIACPTPSSTEHIVEWLATLAPTQLFAPPATLIALVEAFERRAPRPAHRLKVVWSGTTDLPDAARDRLARVFAVPVIVGYGMTESGSITQTPFPPDLAPPGSVGCATNIDIAVSDESGHLLGPGEAGELVVRGPELFDGYENDAEANRAAFRDGWFRTGDAGHVDRDGFVFLAGRLKDIINRGGTKIAPVEIESALMQHSQVIEAAAFATAHPTLGQDIAAAVVLRGSEDEAELRRFLRARLAAWKIPTRILARSDLPRTSSGKIDRAALADWARQSAAAAFEPPSSPEEAALARIFCDVLETPSVGRRDNFFHLGGDSLRGMRVLAAVESTFGVVLTLEALFDDPTLAGLAAAIRAHANGERAGAPTAKMRAPGPNR